MSTIRLPLDVGYVVLRRPRTSAAFEAAARRLVRLARWPGRVLESRRVLRSLAAMSDHELADIGLGRHDLRDATGLPLDADPSALLARRADARVRRAL